MRLLHQKGESNETHRALIFILHHALYDGILIWQLSETVQKSHRNEKPTPSPQFVDSLGHYKHQELHGTEFWMKQLCYYKRPTLPRRTDATVVTTSTSMGVNVPLSAARMNEACKFFDVAAQCFGQVSLAWRSSRRRFWGCCFWTQCGPCRRCPWTHGRRPFLI